MRAVRLEHSGDQSGVPWNPAAQPPGLGWVSGRKAGKSHGSPIPAGIRLESRGPWVPSMTTSSALAPRALF